MITITETYLILKSNIFALVIIFLLFELLHNLCGCFAVYVSFFVLNSIMPVFVYLAKNYFLQFPYLEEEIFIMCDKEGYDNIKKWFSIKNGFGFKVKEIVYVDKLTNSKIKEKIDNCLKKGYSAAAISVYRYPLFKISYYIDYIQKKIGKIIIFPRISSLPLFNIEVINSVNYKGLAFMLRNNLLNPVDKFVKRIFDLFFSFVAFIFLIPALVVVYVAVLLIDKTYPIYRQERVGEDGRIFKIYKFKTMMDKDKFDFEKFLNEHLEAKKEYEMFKKLKDDPRVTKLGKILRKFSVDELPQLLNVLKGEMSLVGPRPYLKSEIKEWGVYFEYYKMVRPGITGLWQVSGRNKLTFDERIKLDVWYVKNWSLELDIVILIKTVVSVITGKGSY